MTKLKREESIRHSSAAVLKDEVQRSLMSENAELLIKLDAAEKNVQAHVNARRKQQIVDKWSQVLRLNVSAFAVERLEGFLFFSFPFHPQTRPSLETTEIAPGH